MSLRESVILCGAQRSRRIPRREGSDNATGSLESVRDDGSKDPAGPREIEVHIEELVLHGVDPRMRWQLADALQNELRLLLEARGLPDGWQSGRQRIDAGSIPAFSRTTLGMLAQQVAAAVHNGGRR